MLSVTHLKVLDAVARHGSVNGLALHAHRAPGVHATPLAESPRQIYAAVYGDPPDPPATSALIEILASTARTFRPLNRRWLDAPTE